MVRIAALLLVFASLAPAYAATTRYVTDQLVVSVRQSTSDGAPVVATLRTGDAVEVLDEDGRFLKVRTAQGAKGFVVAQYFTAAAPAATQNVTLLKEVDRLKAELAAALQERDEARNRLKTAPAGGDAAAVQQLQADLAAAERKYQELAAGAKEVVTITKERDQLRQEVQQLTADLDAARQKGGTTQQPSTMRWFFAGAGVLFFGWILGKMSRQKRRY